MSTPLRAGDVTALLAEWSRGEESAVDALWRIVYDELRHIADRYLRRESDCRTLQPTALVHEAFIRLVGQEAIAWQDRAHFFAIAATTMRRILIEHARRRLAAKRGAGISVVEIDDSMQIEGVAAGNGVDVLALDAALEKLAALDERQARVVEVRFFAGLSVEETAAALGISTATVKREWRSARAWLLRELEK